MKKLLICLALMIPVLFFATATQAQLLKKIKDKVEKKVLNKSDEGKKDESGGNQGGNEPEQSGNKPTNKGGGGLKNTPPPDVNQQIADAEQAHGAGKYSDARYSIQQALMSVEIQIGREVLKSLPPEIVKLPKDTLQDKVMSTQWGWNNLTIYRVYTDKKDKELSISIGNNSLYSALATAYFSNMYMQEANADGQKAKQVRVKGNKAMIQYDDSKGYTLIMPMGQTSLIVWSCINFADETEVMTAAESFDIDGIKKMMGEK